MAKDIETLKQQALQIKNEVEDGANTADRVGGMFEDMLDYNEEQKGKKLSISDLASGRGESTTTAMTQAAVTQELVAQDEKLTELSSNTVKFTVSDNEEINRYFKELYIPTDVFSTIDADDYVTIQISKSYKQQENLYYVGFNIIQGDKRISVMNDFDNSSDAEPKNIHYRNGVYAVINWKAITFDTKQILYVKLNKFITDVYFSPTINQYLFNVNKGEYKDRNEILDNTLGYVEESMFNIYLEKVGYYKTTNEIVADDNAIRTDIMILPRCKISFKLKINQSGYAVMLLDENLEIINELSITGNESSPAYIEREIDLSLDTYSNAKYIAFSHYGKEDDYYVHIGESPKFASYEEMYNLKICSEKVENTIYGKKYEQTSEAVKGETLNLRQQGFWGKGTTVYLSINSDNANVSAIAFGVTYPQGDILNIANPKMNKVAEYTLTDDCTQIRAYIGWVSQPGSVTMRVETIGLYNKVEKINGFTIDILGDSYSTYGLWIPEGNSVWYGKDGIDGNNDREENDVNSVTQTWWYKLCERLGLSLMLNESYSGSTICNTGYSGDDASSTSFIHRMMNSMGQGNALKPKPNIIVLFGGTNDDWADSPLGELKYSGWTEDDLKNVLPAICYMFDYVKKWNPGALILNVVNTDLKEGITNGFREASEYYGIHNIELENIDKQAGHPSIIGMESICNQIYQYIKTSPLIR